MKNMALKHAREYQQRKEIGDYAWVKALKLVDRVVPACEGDMKKLESGSTWQHWLHFSSEDLKDVWKAIGSLKNA